MIKINGTYGEGGGQILRSALSLSCITGKAFTIENIRGKRNKPGLLRQHLTAVQAAAEICGAELEGDNIKSQSLIFKPQYKPMGGNYIFDIGSAGSTSLVAYTILWPLLFCKEKSQIIVKGGTHNPSAPPFEFLQKTLLPVLNEMGFSGQAQLQRPGFYPAGGGLLKILINPVNTKLKFNIPILQKEKDELEKALKNIQIHFSNIPNTVKEKQYQLCQKYFPKSEYQEIEHKKDYGSGNVIQAIVDCSIEENKKMVFSAFGTRGVSSEKLFKNLEQNILNYCKHHHYVNEHLADQLILPLALIGKGQFTAQKTSPHLLSNIYVVEKFLDVGITTKKENIGIQIQI